MDTRLFNRLFYIHTLLKDCFFTDRTQSAQQRAMWK